MPERSNHAGLEPRDDSTFAQTIMRERPDDLSPLPELAPGRYRHYKGGEYEVLGVARHSETLKPVVVYRPLYGAPELWVRPHDMFVEEVEVGGRRQPRFVRVDG